MNNTKNPIKPPNSNVSEYLEDDMVAVSSDLTGLVQAPPADEAQAESYAELHNIPIPEIKRRNTEQ